LVNSKFFLNLRLARGFVASIQHIEARLQNIASLLRVGSDTVDLRLEQILSKSKEMEKEISALKSSLASSGSDDLLSGVTEVNGVHVLAARQDGLDAAGLRNSVDHLKNQLTTCAVVIASVENGKVRIAAGVTRDLLDKLKSGDLVNFVAGQVGGKGGGRPDFAQAGGTQPENLSDALASVASWVEEKSS
jgi:alanyl-tRNA synthetase